MNIRIGQGYDVHRLVEGREMILGGVKIPHSKGCLGHSDADVLVHSIIDSLLGAAGFDDIGTHFPDDDPAYKNADSCSLLKIVVEMLKKRSWRIINIDCVLILEKPKLREYIPAIREKLSLYLGIRVEDISVKAKTGEGMGFTGTEQGIACISVALIQKEEYL